jgi:hypothetical protein
MTATQRDTIFGGEAKHITNGELPDGDQAHYDANKCIFTLGSTDEVTSQDESALMHTNKVYSQGPTWLFIDLESTTFIQNITVHGLIHETPLSTHLIIHAGESGVDNGRHNPHCGGHGRMWHAGTPNSQAVQAGFPNWIPSFGQDNWEREKQKLPTDGMANVQCDMQGRYIAITKNLANEHPLVLCGVDVWATGFF